LLITNRDIVIQLLNIELCTSGMHRKYKRHLGVRKKALRYITRSLACFLARSLTHSRFSRSLARSRLSRSLARSFSISIHTCLHHCQTWSLAPLVSEVTTVQHKMTYIIYMVDDDNNNNDDVS